MKKLLCLLLCLILAVGVVSSAQADTVYKVPSDIHIEDLYALYDEVVNVCLNGYTEFEVYISPACRKNVGDDNLWDGIWSVLWQALSIDYKVSYANWNDGTLYVKVENALLRDGIRIYFGYMGDPAVTLTADEKRALSIAQSAVNDMLQKYPYGSIALETAIYDYICNHIEYKKEGDDQRYYSTVHGLLHGEGTCQVYADLFYLMASMAGFVPQYVCGKAPGSHLWNAIAIGGENVMVDVCFGDMGGNYPPSHYFMNFGVDRKEKHTWSKYVFPYSYAQTTDDSHSFYCNQSANTGYVPKDLNDAATYFVWKAQHGQMVAEVLMKGKTYSDNKTIHDAIYQALRNQGYSTNNKNWRLWNLQKGNDTVILVEWTQF